MSDITRRVEDLAGRINASLASGERSAALKTAYELRGVLSGVDDDATLDNRRRQVNDAIVSMEASPAESLRLQPLHVIALVVVVIAVFFAGLFVGRHTGGASASSAQPSAASQAVAPSHLGLPLPSATPVVGTSSIRGILVYYFNSNFGNKPDAGARVYLVRGEIPAPSTNVALRTVAEQAFRQTIADGQGAYQFSNLPPGTYSVLLQSSHSKGSEEPDLQGKLHHKVLVLQEGEGADVSHDFGMTYW